jgi:hypothetical protein
LEEKELQRLKDEYVSLKETAISATSSQMARAVSNNLANLDQETMSQLRTAIEIHDADDGDNII